MPRGVYTRTKSAWNKGKTLSESHKKALSKAWNYEKHITEKLRSTARANIEHLHTPEVYMKISKALLNIKTNRIPKTAFKKGVYAQDKHWNWKGGITPLNHKIRTSAEYIKWRKEIFERDNYSCIHCGIRGVEIHADHIQPFSQFPELRLEVTNGRTLCKPCHQEIGWRHYETN